MKQDSNGKIDINASVSSAIQATERAYREKLFASGCTCVLPIYRIADNVASVEALQEQLEASPYIQKGVRFTEAVTSALIDMKLYAYAKKALLLSRRY